MAPQSRGGQRAGQLGACQLLAAAHTYMTHSRSMRCACTLTCEAVVHVDAALLGALEHKAVVQAAQAGAHHKPALLVLHNTHTGAAGARPRVGPTGALGEKLGQVQARDRAAAGSRAAAGPDTPILPPATHAGSLKGGAGHGGHADLAGVGAQVPEMHRVAAARQAGRQCVSCTAGAGVLPRCSEPWQPPLPSLPPQDEGRVAGRQHDMSCSQPGGQASTAEQRT